MKKDAAWWRQYRKQRTGLKGVKPKEAAPEASPVETPKAPLPHNRRSYVKTEDQIRSYIINAMRSYGANPKALLHVLVGFISQLQEEMKRDRESDFAIQSCSGLHPGQPSYKVYCKLCHDAEMAGRFGSIPGKAPALAVFEDEDADMVPPIAPLKE